MSTHAEKNIITASKAPKAIGPYSHAVQFGALIFASGQIGLNPETGELVSGGIEAETHQVFANIQAVLEASGVDLTCVLKTTVFLRDMADFPKMNAIYGTYFTENHPARSTIAVAGLPKGGAVEIEVIAFKR